MTEQSIIFLNNEGPVRGGVRASLEKELDELPTTDAEPDGMGKAMGAVVGGALGASAGLAGGAAGASPLLPRGGTPFSKRFGAAASPGLGGAPPGGEGRGVYPDRARVGGSKKQ